MIVSRTSLQAVVVAGLMGASLAGCGSEKAGPKSQPRVGANVAAKVQNHVITKTAVSRFRGTVNSLKDATRYLVVAEWVAQEARSSGLKAPSRSKVEATYEREKGTLFRSEAKYRAFLRKNSLTPAVFRSKLRTDIMQGALMDKIEGPKATSLGAKARKAAEIKLTKTLARKYRRETACAPKYHETSLCGSRTAPGS